MAAWHDLPKIDCCDVPTRYGSYVKLPEVGVFPSTWDTAEKTQVPQCSDWLYPDVCIEILMFNCLTVVATSLIVFPISESLAI